MSTNTEHVQGYLDWMTTKKRRSPITVYGYGLTYQKLLEHLDCPLAAATTEQLEDFVFNRQRRTAKMHGTDPAPATLKREIMEIRSLYKWLVNRGIVEPSRDPSMRLRESAPTVHNEDPKPADEEVWRRLWFSNLDDGERVAFGLGFFCGLRRAEITGLRAHQFVGGRLVGLKRKGGQKQGLPYESCLDLYSSRRGELCGDITELFVMPLARLRKARADAPALLPWADERRWTAERVHAMPEGFINPDLFNRRLMRALRRNGLAEDAVTPHQLRHGFCTNLIACGVPIQVVSRLAGHSSLQITMRYVEVGDDPLRQYIDGDHNPVPLRSVSRFPETSDT